jgi:hypothetical protein
MKAHDPRLNILKQGIRQIEWALDYLDDCYMSAESDDLDWDVIENASGLIRNAYRDLKDLV